LNESLEPIRPSIVAILLWILGFVLIVSTIYSMIIWRGWLENIRDALIILTAFSSGITAIATGALIDMHTMRYKRRNRKFDARATS